MIFCGSNNCDLTFEPHSVLPHTNSTLFAYDQSMRLKFTVNFSRFS